MVATLALLLQLVLVTSGSAVLAEQDPPDPATRLARFFCYVTVQSNALVAVTSLLLTRDARAVACVGVAVLFVLVALGVRLVDRRLAPRP